MLGFLRARKPTRRGSLLVVTVTAALRPLPLKAERIDDHGSRPNHSCRQRLKTFGRRPGLATDIVDALVGHQHRTVGDGYREFPAEALLGEFSKIPKLQLEPKLLQHKFDTAECYTGHRARQRVIRTFSGGNTW